MDDNTTQVSSQINNAVNNALGVGALAAIYTGNFVTFGKVGGALALIAKTITENGVYSAASDGADGYSVVTVDVGGIEILAGGDSPSEDIGEDGQLYLKFLSGEIPSDYQRLEYISCASNGAYINTDITHTAQAYFEIDCKWNSTPSNNQGIFGCGIGGGNQYIINGNDGGYIAAGAELFSISDKATTRHKYKADNTGIYIDGERQSYTVSWGAQSNNKYLLFAFMWKGVVYNSVNATVYSAKIWSGDTIVSLLYPVKRLSDDVIGMYDVVRGQFFANVGSGSFTGGEPVNSISSSDEIQHTVTGAYVKKDNNWIDLFDADINDINLGGE